MDTPLFAGPWSVDRGPGYGDVRHEVRAQAVRTFSGMSASIAGMVRSGAPFTPMIAQDVNGDGFRNDRAFIFDPARRGDDQLAKGTRDLLQSGNSSAACLAGQLGRVAGVNSCRGPWTYSINGQLSIAGKTIRASDRITTAITVQNLPALVDRLVHGRDGLRGWGDAGIPDPVLYTVRGFDPVNNRFDYAINPRFGNPQSVPGIPGLPFRLSIDVSIDWGVPVFEQQLDRVVGAGRWGRSGPRLSRQDLKRRYARQVPDPFAALLEARDSLLLTREQTEALEVARAAYLREVDSLWTDLAGYLDDLGDRYDTGAALTRVFGANDAVWERARQAVRRVLPDLLVPVQLSMVPWPVSVLLASDKPIELRMLTP